MRIPYVVRGEARPLSWIIMIYGLAERGKGREREKEREVRREKVFLDDIIIAENGEKKSKSTVVAKSFPSKTKTVLNLPCGE